MTEKWATKIKLLILDVDGVLTDGSIIIDDNGVETKHFNAKDGYGLRKLMDAGIDVAIITGRRSRVVEIRAKDLGIHEIHQKIKDKATVCKDIIKRKKLGIDQTCCVGDDLPELCMFGQVGAFIAVADAVTEIRKVATYITEKKGGRGAVREVCETILKAQNKWPSIDSFLKDQK